MPYIFAPAQDTKFEELEGLRIFEERTTARNWILAHHAAPDSSVTFAALNTHHFVVMEFFREGGSAEIGRLLFHPYTQGN